jgi:hypothetical protein
MNGPVPSEKKRRLYGTALRKLQLLGAFHVTAFLTKIFGAPFWFFEQRRGRLADWLDNERSLQ